MPDAPTLDDVLDAVHRLETAANAEKSAHAATVAASNALTELLGRFTGRPGMAAADVDAAQQRLSEIHTRLQALSRGG